MLPVAFLALVQMNGPAIKAAEPPGSTAPSSSFTEIYNATKTVSNGQEVELQHQADNAAKEKRYVEASAKYLAAAAHPFVSGNFERARPALDKAFLMAAQTSIDEQNQMLQTLSRIVADSRDLRDNDVYKYLAQQRLKLLQKRQGTTAVDRYREIQTLAFSCSQHKRYKEAETLLLETLADLQSIKPAPDSLGDCESMLARVYEASGQIELAKQYYERAISFVKQNRGRRNIDNVLHTYLWFLLKNKMFKEAVPAADEYYNETTSPEYARWRNRVSFAMIAREFADVNMDEANKYYRAQFENQMEGTKTAMNMGYGNTVAEWAAMLQKYGKTSEAIAVLKEGMAFCRTAQWPDAFDRYMPEMFDPCEKYLRLSNRNTEADNLRASYEKEKVARKENAGAAHDRKIAEDSSNPNARAADQVHALTELAYRAYDGQKCAEGRKLLDQAVAVYEKNANNKDNPLIYSYFQDVSSRFAKCGHQNESKQVLLRIIKVRMVAGFQDPDGPRMYICGIGRRPTEALEDYCGPSSSRTTEASLNELLIEAKASNKPSNMVFILSRLDQFNHTNKEKVTALEELELWKAKENDPSLLFSSMIRTAEMYVQMKQFEKATIKWKAAVSQAESTNLSAKGMSFPVSGYLDRLGGEFMHDGQLAGARELYIAAYKQALHEPRDLNTQRLVMGIESLAAKYRDSGDIASGAALMDQILQLSTIERGADSLLEREWLLKLADYYATSGQKDKAKKACAEFLASINKPGMTVSKVTKDEMVEHARILNENGYTSEAALIDKKLKELEGQQCTVMESASAKHSKSKSTK